MRLGGAGRVPGRAGRWTIAATGWDRLWRLAGLSARRLFRGDDHLRDVRLISVGVEPRELQDRRHLRTANRLSSAVHGRL